MSQRFGKPAYHILLPREDFGFICPRVFTEISEVTASQLEQFIPIDIFGFPIGSHACLRVASACQTVTAAVFQQ
jgi:hypothetical protein